MGRVLLCSRKVRIVLLYYYCLFEKRWLMDDAHEKCWSSISWHWMWNISIVSVSNSMILSVKTRWALPRVNSFTSALIHFGLHNGFNSNCTVLYSWITKYRARCILFLKDNSSYKSVRFWIIAVPTSEYWIRHACGVAASLRARLSIERTWAQLEVP